jgi:CRP-like cAMP-binding protein
MEEKAILREGDHFGDFALIHQKPRSATIRCLEDCTFAVIDKALYDTELKNIKNTHNAKIKFLASIPFFSRWTKTTLAKFTYYLKRESYRRNQVVFREGEPCTHISLIIAGEFEAKKRIKSFHAKALEAERAKAGGGKRNLHKIFKTTGVVG